MPLTRRHEIGQLLVASFHGTSVPVELRALAREFDLGGVVLFSRNIEAPEQVAELAEACAALGRTDPAWVAIDQEGGRVARLREPFTRWPPMATLGRAGSDSLASRFAAALARELKAVGITLNLAPVLDVLTNPKNSVIGDRALAADAATVARLGRMLIRAAQAGGVAACGKHFPGHGDTSADSHEELPLVDQPPDRLRAIELEPFRAAIAEGVAAIMTAHVLVPAFDEQRPATLSAAVVQALLRDELGFDGMVLSDDLEMRAVSAQFAVPEAAVEAIRAGCDAVLIGGGDPDLQACTVEALVRALECGRISGARFAEAGRRLRLAKQRWLPADRPPLSVRLRELSAVLGSDAHQAVAAEMAAFL